MAWYKKMATEEGLQIEEVIIQEEQKMKDRQRRNLETRKRQRLLAEEQRRAGTSDIASRYTITPREDAGIAQMLGPGQRVSASRLFN